MHRQCTWTRNALARVLTVRLGAERAGRLLALSSPCFASSSQHRKTHGGTCLSCFYFPPFVNAISGSDMSIFGKGTPRLWNKSEIKSGEIKIGRPKKQRSYQLAGCAAVHSRADFHGGPFEFGPIHPFGPRQSAQSAQSVFGLRTHASARTQPHAHGRRLPPAAAGRRAACTAAGVIA